MTTGTIIATSVNVRRPTPDGNIVGFLQKGTQVEIIDGGTQADSYFITSTNGDSETVGFVGKQFISLDQTTGPPPPPPPPTAGAPNAQFLDLIQVYKAKDIEFPQLKAVTIAQWILESGWGNSQLALQFNNFGGLKFRNELSGVATKVLYQASDGPDFYCAFKDKASFIDGYWQFIGRPPYAGFKDHVASPDDYIKFIAPIYTPTQGYADRVLNLLPISESFLTGAGSSSSAGHAEQHGDGSPVDKPQVRFIATTHQASRNGATIDHIIIHYTTSRNIDGVIEHFSTGLTNRVSAHYIIAQDGSIVQMVDDSNASWHSGSADMNARSIGIEHCAAEGDLITPPQQDGSIRLIRWLVHQYNIPVSNILPHDAVHSTDCPGQLLSAFGATHAEAVRNWIAANL
jgi:hypothetical protein